MSDTASSFWDSLKGVATDFTLAAQARLSSAIARYSTPKTPVGQENINVGKSLFDLMYAYGAGKFEQEKQKLIDQFLASKTGQEITETATKQRIQTILEKPTIWLVIAIIFLGLFFVVKKA